MDPDTPGADTEERPRLAMVAAKVAGLSILVNAALAGAKYGLGLWSGSLALRADAVHSLGDVVASMTVLAGIYLARLRRAGFPYGLYKMENLVALLSAGAIFLAAWEIGKEAFHAAVAPDPTVSLTDPLPTAASVAALIAIPLIFSRYEARAARETGSPALEADAGHMFVEVLSGAAILASLIAAHFGWQLDWFASLVVAVVVAWTGWGIGLQAVRVLLDASVEREILNRVEDAILEHPLVTEVRELKGRNAGSFRFIQASVALSVHDLDLAHEASHEIGRAVREAAANVDEVVIHYAPFEKPTRTYAASLDEEGRVAEHFGEAPVFRIVTVSNETGEVLDDRHEPSPFAEEGHGQGLQVARWLMGMEVDVVVTRAELKGKGPYYALHDARVRILQPVTDGVEATLADEGVRL